MKQYDKIKIENLEVFGNHGVFPEENALGQKFLIHAVLYTDTRKAGETDELTDSIHYGEVCHYITAFMRDHTYQLIEAAAEHLAEALLLDIPKLAAVDLEIKKPWAPIGLPLETVSVQIHRGWESVCLGIGSNVGDKRAYLESGIEALKKVPKIRNVKVSEFIETEPYGVVDQDIFLNGCICLETILDPEELLVILHQIEKAAGRERTLRWGPRTLDLDILLFGDRIYESDTLIIPHLDMHNRQFVLEPLVQLCPGRVHPVLHKTIYQLLEEKGEWKAS